MPGGSVFFSHRTKVWVCHRCWISRPSPAGLDALPEKASAGCEHKWKWLGEVSESSPTFVHFHDDPKGKEGDRLTRTNTMRVCLYCHETESSAPSNLLDACPRLGLIGPHAWVMAETWEETPEPEFPTSGPELLPGEDGATVAIEFNDDTSGCKVCGCEPVYLLDGSCLRCFLKEPGGLGVFREGREGCWIDRMADVFRAEGRRVRWSKEAAATEKPDPAPSVAPVVVEVNRGKPCEGCKTVPKEMVEGRCLGCFLKLPDGLARFQTFRPDWVRTLADVFGRGSREAEKWKAEAARLKEENLALQTERDYLRRRSEAFDKLRKALAEASALEPDDVEDYYDTEDDDDE